LWAAEGKTKKEIKELLKPLIDNKIKSAGKTSVSSFIEASSMIDATELKDLVKGLSISPPNGNINFEDGAIIETKASF
jgi:hypothetical protein